MSTTTTTSSSTTTTTLGVDPNAFITEWNMTAGTFTLPLRSGYTYNMMVDWGDGSPLSEVTAYDDADATHTYTAGTYQISITGTCGAWYINNIIAIRPKITKVIQWGNVGFAAQGLNSAFYGCNNLSVLPVGAMTGVGAVTAMNSMFFGCTSISEIPEHIFDEATSLGAYGFYQTFTGCTNLESIPEDLFKYNTGVSGYAFYRTFHTCTKITSIPEELFRYNINVSDNGFSGTFQGCTKITSIPGELFRYNINVSNSGFSGTFMGCTGIESIPVGLFMYNTDVTNDGFYATFSGCTKIISIPEDLFKYNIALTTNAFYKTFQGCTGLSSIPENLFMYNTDVADSAFRETFSQCMNIMAIPENLFKYNSKVSTYGFYSTFSGLFYLDNIPENLFAYNTLVSSYGFGATFNSCISLRKIPANLFKNNINVLSFGFTSTFSNCRNLIEIPQDLFRYNILVGNSGFGNTFASCTQLEYIPQDLFRYNINVGSNGFSGTFSNCSKLRNVPEGLFKYNINVGAGGFVDTFKDCRALKLNKWIFCDPGDEGVRFKDRPSSFTNCFSRSVGTSDLGSAPELWNYDFGTVTPVITGCFSGAGNNPSTLFNYCDIPSGWGANTGLCVDRLLHISSIRNDEYSELLSIVISSASIPVGSTLVVYASNTLSGLESIGNIVPNAKADDHLYQSIVYCDEEMIYVLVVLDDGLTREEKSISVFHYKIEQISTTRIDIVKPLDSVRLNSPRHSFNHSLVYWNGYIYGTARGAGMSFNTNDHEFFKINAYDYSEIYQVQLIVGSNRINSDQTIYCNGYLWIQQLSYGNTLLRIDPSDLSYVAFSFTGTVSLGQPIGTDGEYLYVTNDDSIIKLNTNNLLGSGVSYGYDGSSPVPMPSGTELGSCVIIQKHPVYMAYSHSVQIDARYIYVAVTSITSATPNGYDPDLGIYLCHLQKIDKTTMATVADVTIPKCTDDMVQDTNYIYLAPEYSTSEIPLYGDSWGLLAVRKSDMHIRFLKALNSEFNTEDEADRTAYGVQYFGKFILVQLVKSKKSIVIRTDKVDEWGQDYPIGGATEKIYEFSLNNMPLSAASNELVLDSSGTFHANTWETNTIVYKFTESELVFTACPIVESYIVEHLVDKTKIGGFVLDDKGSAVIETGFYYSKDPNNLSTKITSSGVDVNFNETLTLPPGLYFFKAYAVNSVGECYGDTLPFIVGNTVILNKDNDDAIVSLESVNSGHAVRCCKPAPGIADGVTGIVVDVHGNEYPTVVINEIEWMAKDLIVTRYADSQIIPNLPDSLQWSQDETGALSAYNNNWENSCIDGVQDAVTTTTTT